MENLAGYPEEVAMNGMQQQHRHHREGMVFDHRPVNGAGAGPDLISGDAGAHPAASKHPAARGLNGSHPRAAHQELFRKWNISSVEPELRVGFS